ncbi:hypothetical protein D3C85_1389070 [compost metagenome]
MQNLSMVLTDVCECEKNPYHLTKDMETAIKTTWCCRAAAAERFSTPHVRRRKSLQADHILRNRAVRVAIGNLKIALPAGIPANHRKGNGRKT